MKIILLASFLFSVNGWAAGDAARGEKYFTDKTCATCHSLTDKKEPTHVGPALKGATKRHDDKWLKAWIKDPTGMLAKKDPVAMKLLAENNNVPMVTLGLNDQEVEDLIAFLKVNDAKKAEAPAAKKKKF